MTTAAVSPITNEITSVLNGVITDVQLLLGESASVILATVDGTAVLTVSELSIIVSELVHVSKGSIIQHSLELNAMTFAARSRSCGCFAQILYIRGPNPPVRRRVRVRYYIAAFSASNM